MMPGLKVIGNAINKIGIEQIKTIGVLTFTDKKKKKRKKKESLLEIVLEGLFG